MITLLFTYFVVTYLLAPAAVFRFFVSIFVTLKNFQRNKTQEFVFAIGASLVPFFLTWLLVTRKWCPFIVPVDGSLADRWIDYRTVFEGFVNEKVFSDPRLSESFWRAFGHAWRRQVDFLSWYYGIIAAEGLIFALLVKAYGRWKDARLFGRKVYGYIARKLLLPHLSEWSLLLTSMNFPARPNRELWVDILETDGTLYRGLLGQFFLGPDGALTGIVLAPKEPQQDPTANERPPLWSSPVRFEREKYETARKYRPFSTHRNSFWRWIPSGAFYIPTEKIVNLNISYEEAAPQDTTKEATRELADEGLQFSVEPITPEELEQFFKTGSLPIKESEDSTDDPAQ